jgi:hypothetical protein
MAIEIMYKTFIPMNVRSGFCGWPLDKQMSQNQLDGVRVGRRSKYR